MFLPLLLVLAVSSYAQIVKKELITDPAKFPENLKESDCESVEKYDKGPICERSCEEPWKMTCYNTSGCRCTAGLFRCSSGWCSLYKYCSGVTTTGDPKCGTNELFVTATSKPNLTEIPACEPTCQNKNRTDCPERNRKLMSQCRCKPGYIRDVNVCVEEAKCT